MNLDSILHDNVETLETVNSWYQKLYRDKFQKYFENQKELYKRMQSKSRSITDTELETILIDIPLDLFSVAEMLNTLKLQTEVLKLSIKPKIKELSQNSKESTQTKRDQDAEMQVIGDRILIKVYESVINQVESQITFSKCQQRNCGMQDDVLRNLIQFLLYLLLRIFRNMKLIMRSPIYT